MEYVYRCERCNCEFSVTGSFETLAFMHPYCPICNQDDKVIRVYTPIASIFVGTGWGKDKNGG
jgi:predicted nucleic acid-binding Zn ribbon protein